MRRLALFARPPAPGRVKTRLSPALPAPIAAFVYEAILADTVAAANAAGVDERRVCWAEEHGGPLPGWESRIQRGTILGERLEHAFNEMLDAGSARALIAGTDVPALRGGHIDQAFGLLERHDVVLGPSSDGGYWCIGLRRPAPALFRDIRWSTACVLAATLERARAGGLSVALADPLADLDTPADLACLLGALARADGACGARTRRALAATGLAPPWLSAARPARGIAASP